MGTAMGVLLATLAALAWAGLDALRKRLTRSASSVVVAAVLAAGAVPVFVTWAACADTLWVLEGRLGHYAPPAAAAVLSSAAAYILFLRALQRSPLSVTIPMLSLTPVATLLLGAAINREAPGLVATIGIGVVVAGALGLHWRAEGSLWRNLRDEPGTRYMAAVAALWSLAATFDKAALDHASVPGHAAVQTAGTAALSVGLLLVRGRGGELWSVVDNKGWFAAAITLSVAAIGLQFAAMTLVEVAVVETLKRAGGIVLAVVFGRLWFGEPITRPKLIGGLAIVAGTLILAASGEFL